MGILNGLQLPSVSRVLQPEPCIDSHEEHDQGDHPFPWQGPAHVFPEGPPFIALGLRLVLAIFLLFHSLYNCRSRHVYASGLIQQVNYS